MVAGGIICVIAVCARHSSCCDGAAVIITGGVTDAAVVDAGAAVMLPGSNTIVPGLALALLGLYLL